MQGEEKMSQSGRPNADSELDRMHTSPKDAQYRLLVDYCSDLIWNMNPDGIFLDLSKSWKRVTGYEPTSLVGTSFVPLIHPDDVTACRQYLQNVITSREVLHSPEYRVKHSDGTWHWHFGTGSPVINPYGESVSMVGISRDITEPKLMEEALRKNERLYRFLSENTSDVVWQQDANMRFTYLNNAAANFSGYSVQEVLGRSSLDFFTAEGREIVHQVFACRREMEGRSEGHKTIIFEAPQIRKDGSTFWTEIATTPIYDDAGTIAGFNGITRNIDKRKRAETERERLIAELQATLTRVKQLEGILRICANCKKICDDAGNWHPIETYIQKHSDADFSHGICPDCQKELYPDFKK